MKPTKHILICDINIKKQGHYIGYNQYILDHYQLAKPDSSTQVSFLYNNEAKDLLNFSNVPVDHVHFFEASLSMRSTSKGRRMLFKQAIEIAAKLDVDHMVFMDLDQYQGPIFFTKSNIFVSGILFRPHHRITPSNNRLATRASTWVKRLKKILAEKLLIVKKNVKHIFILNDEEGVAELNRYHGSKKFEYLPDPVFVYSPPVKRDKSNDKFRFLIFGAINERKNITNILKAYHLAEFPFETEMYIVGSSQPAYLEYLDGLMASLTNLPGSNKTINVQSKFVSDEEMDTIFSESDVCLLIYKDFFGSSGLLGRAALHKLKSIGPNVGLLQKTIQNHHLGDTCDPNDINSIKQALEKIPSLQIPDQNFETYYQYYSPEKFLKVLMNS